MNNYILMYSIQNKKLKEKKSNYIDAMGNDNKLKNFYKIYS